MIKFLLNFILIFFYFLNVHAQNVYPEYADKLTFLRADQGVNYPDISDIAFNADGTRIFVGHHLTHNTTHIFQYDLGTAWDISTLDISSLVTANLKEDNHAEVNPANNSKLTIDFNDDGTKIFILGSFGASTHIYNLTTAYDISSIGEATYVDDDGIDWRNYLVPGESASAQNDIELSHDGTRMFLLDGDVNDSKVVEYQLSTPFDQSTASYNGKLEIEDTITYAAMTVEFDDDGTRMYVGESSNSSQFNNIYVWKLSTPYSVTSATYAGKWQVDFRGVSDSKGANYAFQFGKQGMKLYVTSNEYTKEDNTNTIYDDVIFEYDLICPYGIVVCELDETNVQTDTAVQIEFAKNVIKHNTSTIFRRFDWLRRNENNLNLYTQDIKFNFSPIMGFLPDEIEKPLTKNLITKVSSIKKDPNKNSKKIKKWSFWSHGDVTFGERDNLNLNPREFQTSGLTFGGDRKINDHFFGFALRYGNEDIDILKTNSNKFETESLSLNLYNSLKINDNLNLNSLLGSSVLDIDKFESNAITGRRNGKQIYSAIGLQARSGFTDFNFMPTGKIEFGITELSEYNQFNTSNNLLANHDLLTFETGTLTTGLKFDNLKDITNGKRSINGSFEYVQDFSSDINYEFLNSGDTVHQTKTYGGNSIHNLKSNIGFERILNSGFTFGFNYENFQGLDENSVNEDSLYLKLSHVRDDYKKTNLDFDPINDNLALKYNLNLSGLDFSLNSNHSLKNQELFDAMVKFSNKF